MKQKSGYVKLGLVAFLAVSAILLVYDTFFGSHAAVALGAKLIEAIAPILYGAMIAYLLAPVQLL